MKKSPELTPEMFKRVVRAAVANPNLTDIADACEIHVLTLHAWIRRGMLPNADPLYAGFAAAVRKSRAQVRGKMFSILVREAENDPKWAAYVLERMTEEGEQTWQSTVPGPGDQAVNLQHIMANPPPEVLAAIEAAGMKLVPLEPGDVQPLQIIEGEFADDE